ncbi:hypothetical protein T12_316 [Trichinella patagoniensis]|uniref:Uncharacterized protein n=1 Tax=Trichinella patagoniensis TaxID=990121 RepID=A0A0V0Z1Q1_9BILA|nr:hypothetical protein T12_316 [Trichinella patagoniensis]
MLFCYYKEHPYCGNDFLHRMASKVGTIAYVNTQRIRKSDIFFKCNRHAGDSENITPLQSNFPSFLGDFNLMQVASNRQEMDIEHLIY